jgi:hypothetical protein
MNVDDGARATLAAVLNKFSVDPAKSEAIVAALIISRRLPDGSPLSADDEKLVNDALSSPAGRALVDAVDERTFQVIQG